MTETRLAGVTPDAPWRRLVALGDPGGIGPSSRKGLARHLRDTHTSLAFLDLCRTRASISDTRARHLTRALDFRCDLALVLCGGQDDAANPYDAEVELGRVIGPLRDAGADVLTIVPPTSTRSPLRDRFAAVSMRHGALYLHLESTAQTSVLGEVVRTLNAKVWSRRQRVSS
ncbi:hypothetical protein AB0A63_10020 [Lentzea sp. NPDC042327]|uniref:hypothetical protein n=1 Tax=Lentzea sp. NPDC042327 TaxID=3154801 RepID=UPI0033C76329